MIALLAVVQDFQDPIDVDFPSGQYRHQQQMHLRHGQPVDVFFNRCCWRTKKKWDRIHRVI